MTTKVLANSKSKYFAKKKEALNLENLIQECVKTKGSWGLVQNDIIFAVALWTMIDCGFECLTNTEGSKKVPQKNKADVILPKNWKHGTRKVYEARFVLPPYSEYPVKLVAFPADDILCINALVASVSSGNIGLRSLAVQSTGYVPKPEKNSHRYQVSSLEDFYLLLKNSIIWPIRCAILTEQGVVNNSLCGLSDEIKLKIIKHLSVKELLMLSQTCHDLNRICCDQGLWKTVFHNSFKDVCQCSKDSKECDDASDWKESYRQAYVQKKKGSRGTISDSASGSYHTALEVPYGSQIDFDVD